MDLLTIAAALGPFITKAVDFLRRIFDRGDRFKGSPIWIAVSLGLGVAFALLGDQVTFFSQLVPAGVTRTVGDKVFLGLVCGAFGSGYHEVFDALSGVAKAARRAQDPRA